MQNMIQFEIEEQYSRVLILEQSVGGTSRKENKAATSRRKLGEFGGHATPEVPALFEESSEKRTHQNVIRGASREGRSDLESTLPFDYMPAPKLPREGQVLSSQIIEEKQAERR